MISNSTSVSAGTKKKGIPVFKIINTGVTNTNVIKIGIVRKNIKPITP